MERLLRSTEAQITVTVTSAGEPTEAEGTVTVKVYRENGEELASGNGVHAGGGIYSFALTPAQTAKVDVLKAVWTAKVATVAGQEFTTYHEIVGGFLTTVSAIRSSLPTGASAGDEEIEAARTLAEDWLESACGVAFRPRYEREELDGTGGERLTLGRPMVIATRTATIEGEAAISKLYGAEGVLWCETGWTEGHFNIGVIYEHGYVSVPSQVARAATRLARHFLVEDPSDYDERSSSMTTDEAHYTFITPGMSGAITSIPEVNVVIQQFKFGGIQ